MLPITTTLSIANQIASTISDKLGIEPVTTSGDQLKKDLGLNEFEYVSIQRILNISTPMYVVSFDSRFPYRFISYSKLINLKSSRFLKLKDGDGSEYIFTKLKLTPPFPIEDVRIGVNTGNIFLLRDLAGEYFSTKNLIRDFNENICNYRIYAI